MITGHVAALHALVPVTFRLGNGQPDLTIEFVIDTGFTGFLTLPKAAVEILNLPYLESIPANLATDEEVELPVHFALIRWENVERQVRVLATGKRPLLEAVMN